MLGRKLVAGAAIVATALLAGCSVTTENAAAKVAVGSGSIKRNPALAGRTIAVGSKDFTENILLGHLTMIALQAAGAKVDNRINIKGSVNSRKALVSGDIDVSWEYTGTAWITYLNHTDPIPESRQQYEAVVAEDKQRNNVVWAAPAPANNTYALAVREEKAKEWGLRTLSDLAAFARTHPAEATFCLESEFASRNDGWPGMAKAYGLNAPPSSIRTVDTGVVYTETKKGTSCNFGEVFTTDGRISNLKLVPLEDDRKFFPIYNPALTINGATAAKYPDLVKLLDPVAARLDNDTLRRLNEEVDVKGELASTVAENWMRQQGFIR
ncbi:glycine betaine ABC transporter substrate-binding protein [Planosporangium mesophilum]|uniref:Glycine/betaine ABC transporter substrate-binding protein n=1 Tax=Planosporangium mesophilum TaxID=689768 RepID=A0A8J3T863_9ACTN|nr:glycine betaine ABC transporter substrate-binding protein [Planosporangium mesophilum]NJC83250.1 glycine betaine ABC transporter substrate-binding protein [Planosporangium mesophilum]GII21624.1 glycine/betaine ABC transporter substrate-binding protein [Planosporangium mesophilum]